MVGAERIPYRCGSIGGHGRQVSSGVPVAVFPTGFATCTGTATNSFIVCHRRPSREGSRL
jgi:hypothetical protein